MSKSSEKKLPAGWETAPLSAIIADLVAGVSVNGEDRPAGTGEIGVLKVSAVSEGRFRPEENKTVIAADRGRVATSPRRGDILISRSNTPMLVGASVFVEEDHTNLFLSDKLWRVELKAPARDSARWLWHTLNTPAMRVELAARATGSSSSMKNIAKPTFLSITVPPPPLSVQCRIVAVLDTWARAEETTVRLIEAQTRLRDALRHQMLECDGPLTPLADVTEESRERNNVLGLAAEHVRSVYREEGMSPMRERLIGSNLERYKIVRRDWFAYNPMRLNIGSIARWHGDDVVLVSPDYVVFRCRDGRLDPNYLDHLRRCRRWERFVSDSGNGSVRIRIYYGDLAALRVPLPPINEQRRVAAVLNTADREVCLLNRYLDALRRQKRELMRQLLTGEPEVIRRLMVAELLPSQPLLETSNVAG